MLGGHITLKNVAPGTKFGSSQTGRESLIHLEKQIAAMTVIPDFGYYTDNVLIQQSLDSTAKPNNWKKLLELTGDKDKFEWLMNFIKV